MFVELIVITGPAVRSQAQRKQKDTHKLGIFSLGNEIIQQEQGPPQTKVTFLYNVTKSCMFPQKLV